MTLTTRIFVGMAAGILVGLLANKTVPAGDAHTLAVFIREVVFLGLFDGIGKIFVASLKLLVVPMVFVSLVCGTANLGGHGRMGPMAGKTIALYMLTTALAISLALGLAAWVQPGVGAGYSIEASPQIAPAPSLKEVLINIFPNNPIKAMAEGNMLQVIVFSILFGLAVSRSGQTGKQVAEYFEQMNDVIMQMVMLLMQLAPWGVFALLAKIFFTTGYELIGQLLQYFFTVVGALLIHAGLVYSALLVMFARLNPLAFFLRLRPVMMFGFATASSNATMPVTLEVAEQKLGVDNAIASFTVPLGATINMDGTAIMQGVATVFIAQAFQIDIGFTGYLTVILTATLASIGTAGVPGVGLITLAMVLEQAGLPVEGIALIIGVDRLLDMLRTAVNVTGDSAVSCIVANSEGRLDRSAMMASSPNA